MVHVDRAVLYFDGTSRFNPHGPGGCGYEIIEMDDNGADGITVVQGSIYLGYDCSNEQAGYHGLVAGLRCVRDNLVVNKLYIRGDSEKMMKQLQQECIVRSPRILPLHILAMRFLKDLAYLDSIRFTHVKVTKNRRTHKLAHIAIDEACDNIMLYDK